MKCLFLAVFKKESTNYSQSKCLEAAGIDVVEFDYRWAAAQVGPEERDQTIINAIKMHPPEFVLYSKCNGMDVRVIKETRDLTKHVLWYMDPLNGNFNNELIEKIRACHASVFALRRPFEEAKKYSDNVHFVHEGFDPYVDKPQKMEKRYDVSFIGNVDSYRQRFIDSFPSMSLPRGFADDFSAIVAQSKININFVRNESGCSDRVYRVLANKGFLLTMPWPGMEYDFEPGVDFAVFNTPEEMVVQIREFSKEPGLSVAKEIAKNGYKKVQKFSRHNWAERIKEIVNAV